MPVKITDLEAATTITANDLIQIIDVDDLTMSPAGTNRKITASNAANQLANLISSVPPVMVTALSTKANLNSPTFDGNVVLPTTTSIGPVNNAEIGRLSGVTSGIQGQLDLKANLANPTFTGTVGGITKSMIGLSNVNNTSDADKPVSTATQTALNLKANLASPNFSGNVVLPDTTSIGSVTSAEIGRLSGVTSGIQSQLNGKQATITGAATTIDTENLTASRVLVSDSDGKVSALSQSAPVFVPANYSTLSNSNSFLIGYSANGTLSTDPWWSGIQTVTVPNCPTNTVGVLLQAIVNCNTFANNEIRANYYKSSEQNSAVVPSTSTTAQNITQAQYNAINTSFTRISLDSMGTSTGGFEAEGSATFPLYIDETNQQFKYFLTDNKASTAPTSTPEYSTNIRLLGYYVKI